MIEIIDPVTKILSRDNKNSYSIITYIDLKLEFDLLNLEASIHKLIEGYPILKKRIIENDSKVYLEEDSEFNIKNHYKMINEPYDNFDNYIDIILNSQYETHSKWLLYYISDKEINKYRIYFKIDHAYADGYKIIEMLTSNFKVSNTKYISKHRNTSIFSKLYYLTIGTLILIFNNISIFIEIWESELRNSESARVSYIKCKAFKLSQIKEFTRKNNITVNDFLYSLMIKVDHIYTGRIRKIISCSSINISELTSMNNMVPIFNKITNGLDNLELLNTVNNTFNLYKYSLFVYILSFVIHNIYHIFELATIGNIYDLIIQKCDYVYSNIIGPTHEALEDIHFLTLAKDKEIVFNIISSNDNVNIICSFKEGVIKDTARFEQCIYDAYESLINT